MMIFVQIIWDSLGGAGGSRSADMVPQERSDEIEIVAWDAWAFDIMEY